ncbi:ATP-dependent protease LonB [Terrilactibacillus sp. BCM23-1]|uniref:endopeptidase La n=1 Tax=Terrilactibacillus tamarindi TaxID=2599694 RepID=A0A6N8CUE8_9BACI|nr:ATP-dependent protease LonB [Terrilactibacillus tamarindi]MTT31726.1 ATP-dependent protease LonB [Terrilactibacillus tamarindi]
MNWMPLLVVVQVFFGMIVGLYFWSLLRNQRNQKTYVAKESDKEMNRLKDMRRVALTEPLSESIRPKKMEDIIGQQDGIQALRAAICGANPQHVIIYGPPGVGKTAAARLVLEEAKKHLSSPFNLNSPFVELDATTARFDERGIADPLIGSVHDPIYQGAGAMGQAGIPQPKFGAVTNAHGGILFIDEIGELHPIQINKLLKVLEDRKVFLESAYYSEENTQIPTHIHDIFKNGLPADFRLIGATTRSPEELPPAIRSRCLEVFFNELKQTEIESIAIKAAKRIGVEVPQNCIEKIAEYARSGREAVNLMQIAVGVVKTKNEENNAITLSDIEWVIQSSQLTPRMKNKIARKSAIGVVNGLAVYGPNRGALLEIEATAVRSKRVGTVTMTGIVEEESIGSQQKSIKRKSMVRSSVDNVLTVLNQLGAHAHHYHIHINFPGGVPVDGPSAGIAMAVAVYSAINRVPIDSEVAMTGELSIHGFVKPIGGVVAKVLAAKEAGAKRVIIPEANMQDMLKSIEGIEIIQVSHFTDVLRAVFNEQPKVDWSRPSIPATSFDGQLPSQSV